MGRIIGAAAGKNIKPVTLELGGKSAAIVWKDVDVAEVLLLLLVEQHHFRVLPHAATSALQLMEA